MPLLGLFVQLLLDHGRMPVLLFYAARCAGWGREGAGFLVHGLTAEARLCRLLRRLRMDLRSAGFDGAGGCAALLTFQSTQL